MSDRIATLGKLAYTAYAAAVGGRSVTGAVLPPWEELGDRIQTAWETAAEAVRRRGTASQ